MGWNQSIFPLLIVSSVGPGTGFFVYNGPPAKGNLIAQIVAPGTTTDPFGNHVVAVANFGHWDAGGNLLQHFGIDSGGDIYLANATGATVVRGHSLDGSVWFYNSAGQGAGNMLSSITPAAGTDPSGNPFVQGIVSYQSGTPAINAQLTAGAIQFNRAAITTAAVIGSNNSTALLLSSGQVNNTDVESLLTLGTALTGVVPTILVNNAALEIQESAVPVADGSLTGGPKLFGNTTGQLGVVSDSRHGDGATYDIGEVTDFNTAAVNIPASGFTTVFSRPVGIGSYAFRGKFRLKQGAAGSIPGNIGFTGPATSFGLWDTFWRLQGAATTFESADTSSFATQVNVLGTQTVAGNEITAYYDGMVTFTAAGTFIAGCQADGTHPFTAQPGCKFTMRPVVAV